MKNAFKLGALAVVVSLAVTACGGGTKTTVVDSTKTTTVDTTVKADTTKKDTTVIKTESTAPTKDTISNKK